MSLAQGPPVLCYTTFIKLRVMPDFIAEEIAPTLYKCFVFTRTSEDPSADFTPLSRELFFPVSCQLPWENDDPYDVQGILVYLDVPIYHVVIYT